MGLAAQASSSLGLHLVATSPSLQLHPAEPTPVCVRTRASVTKPLLENNTASLARQLQPLFPTCSTAPLTKCTGRTKSNTNLVIPTRENFRQLPISPPPFPQAASRASPTTTQNVLTARLPFNTDLKISRKLIFYKILVLQAIISRRF